MRAKYFFELLRIKCLNLPPLQIVIFDCVRSVLEKTRVKARDVDILVINCSLFSPTPSLCALVINEFGMRSDILSYNLSGMVCGFYSVILFPALITLLFCPMRSLCMCV